MQRTDATWLTERLTELAEAFGARPVGPKAIKVWIDALGEARPDDVKRALADWPKRNAKMPAPADILKAARESRSDEVEARSRQFAAETGFDAGQLRGSSAVAKEAIARVKAILRSPKPAAQQWAHDIVAGKYPAAGACAHQLAASVVGKPKAVETDDAEAREAEFYGLPA